MHPVISGRSESLMRSLHPAVCKANLVSGFPLFSSSAAKKNQCDCTQASLLSWCGGTAVCTVQQSDSLHGDKDPRPLNDMDLGQAMQVPLSLRGSGVLPQPIAVCRRPAVWVGLVFFSIPIGVLSLLSSSLFPTSRLVVFINSCIHSFRGGAGSCAVVSHYFLPLTHTLF